MEAAEILVKCGMFAEIDGIYDGRKIDHYIGFFDEHNGTRDYRKHVLVDPYADTLEGRRQLDALVGYFRWHQKELWKLSWIETAKQYMSIIDSTVCKEHEWRKARAEYCLEQMKPLEGGDR